ncbi:MAG: hypothetical protein M3303_00310 [Gemmatimonadota bacterium]|nr:hypothetical protein [Gemmatimonadota bacterium]
MMRHLHPRRLGSTVFLTVAGVGLLPTGAAPQRTKGALPAPIRAQLARAYPGWRFAAVAPELRAQLASGQTPDWIAGDFDADGRRDYAVQIVRPSSRDGAQYVLAFLRRGARYRQLVVDSFPETQGSYLALARRGERIADLEADPNGDSTFVLRSDAIHVLFGQESGGTCVYERGRFRCVVSSD